MFLSFCVNCVIQINFNLDTVHKGWNVSDLNPSEFYFGSIPCDLGLTHFHDFIFSILGSGFRNLEISSKARYR